MVNKKHILFIVENNPVLKDTRVWSEASTAKKIGFDVSIICPKNKNHDKSYENKDGVDIYSHYQPVEAEGKSAFLIEYANALLWELLLSFKIFIRKPFHIIHSANPPDHVFLIALCFKMFGVKYIFDHHDISPENYVAKFNRKDFFYRLLKVMEKMTFKTANVVISTNESYKKIAIERGKKNPDSVFVVRNGPNLDKVIFKKENKKWKEGFRHLVCYVGSIGNQEGIENLLYAAKYLLENKNVRDVKFVIVGTGPHWEFLHSLTKQLNIETIVQMTGYISYDDFYEVIATSDLCVNPEHRNPFTDKSTMIKIMDYMTFGKPIVMFETTEGKVTAGESALYIKENNNVEFAETIFSLLKDRKKRDSMGKIATHRVKDKLRWDIQAKNLEKAYEYINREVAV